MGLSDMFMATFKQTYGSGGEAMNNMFFYKRLGSTGTAPDLAEHWINDANIIHNIHGVQSNFIKDVSLRVINLGSFTDFDEIALITTGAFETLVNAPIQDAISYSMKIDTRALRPGGKRFSGQGRDMSANGIWTDATLLTNMEALRIGLATVLEGESDSYAPVVVKRIRLAPDLTHTRVRYRLPETDEELEFGNVTTATVSNKVSHQVSRGNGR